MVWYQTNDQQVWAVVKTLAQIRHSGLSEAGSAASSEALAEAGLAGSAVTA
jgi:hypothetical protein